MSKQKINPGGFKEDFTSEEQTLEGDEPIAFFLCFLLSMGLIDNGDTVQVVVYTITKVTVYTTIIGHATEDPNREPREFVLNIYHDGPRRGYTGHFVGAHVIDDTLSKFSKDPDFRTKSTYTHDGFIFSMTCERYVSIQNGWTCPRCTLDNPDNGSCNVCSFKRFFSEKKHPSKKLSFFEESFFEGVNDFGQFSTAPKLPRGQLWKMIGSAYSFILAEVLKIGKHPNSCLQMSLLLMFLYAYFKHNLGIGTFQSPSQVLEHIISRGRGRQNVTARMKPLP